MAYASDLAATLSDAADLAQERGREPSSAHLLLALFISPNRAGLLLRDQGLDEDAILAELRGAPNDADDLTTELVTHARRLAADVDAAEANCLHLLLAMIAVGCEARELLVRCELDLAALRRAAQEVNDSAAKLQGDAALRAIAREVIDTIRHSDSIEGAARESARAWLRVMVRRLLRKHGYPSDKQEAATNTVLQQAELLPRLWSSRA